MEIFFFFLIKENENEGGGGGSKLVKFGFRFIVQCIICCSVVENLFFRFVYIDQRFNNIDEIYGQVLIIEFGKLFFVFILLVLIIGNSCIMGYGGRGKGGGCIDE